jgi:anti-sigma regulatory factor (Ser/Thr protein kinase)
VSPRESNPDQLFCRLRGSDAIGQAADAARAFAKSQWLGDDELARLCIVIEELVANLYDHGGLAEDDVVELALASEPDGIHVLIFDPGTPFDPWAASPKIERPHRGGGAGIDLVRAWAQFVSYRSSGEGNWLEILLPVRWEG